MAAKPTFVTEEGLQKLKDELEHLKVVKRKEVAEALKQAKAFGDLSENSEYDEAKNEQAEVERHIAELEDILENIEIIKSTGKKNKISDESPIGKALLGAKPGDEVQAETPGGIIQMKVLEIL